MCDQVVDVQAALAGLAINVADFPCFSPGQRITHAAAIFISLKSKTIEK